MPAADRVQLITDVQVWTHGTHPTPWVRFEPKHVVIRNQYIERITDTPLGSLLLQEADVEVIHGDNAYLTPGLIEQHINGALGCDFNQDKLPAIQHTLNHLPRFGITGILPTIITAPMEDMLSAIHTVEEAIHLANPLDTRILGLHLEGPFINPDRKGIHPKSAVHTQWNPEMLDHLLSPHTKIVSLAPELDPEGRLIGYFTERGVRVMAGHSDATGSAMELGIQAGLSGVTHLYNAMRAFHHREPGIVGEALINPALTIEVIPDGVHVHPKAVHLAIQAKGWEQTILTSDAINLAGTAPGTQGFFAAQPIQYQNQMAMNADGTLAGGGILLDQCVRNIVNWGISPFETAIAMASLVPAQYLGLFPQCGTLIEGGLADMVLWNPKTLTVESTWIGGQRVYQQTSLEKASASLA